MGRIYWRYKTSLKIGRDREKFYFYLFQNFNNLVYFTNLEYFKNVHVPRTVRAKLTVKNDGETVLKLKFGSFTTKDKSEFDMMKLVKSC